MSRKTFRLKYKGMRKLKLISEREKQIRQRRMHPNMAVGGSLSQDMQFMDRNPPNVQLHRVSMEHTFLPNTSIFLRDGSSTYVSC